MFREESLPSIAQLLDALDLLGALDGRENGGAHGEEHNEREHEPQEAQREPARPPATHPAPQGRQQHLQCTTNFTVKVKCSNFT